MNGWRRLVALALLLVASLLAPASAGAQPAGAQSAGAQSAGAQSAGGHGARDLVDGPVGSLTVPPLPAGYVTEQRGPLTISYARALERVMAPALARAERDARALGAQFGFREVPPLAVRLVADPATMRRLAPVEAPPPAYAVGVAYPAARLALVSATAPVTWEASNVAQVLRHELSHLMLAEATNHAALPRWLAEGIAVQQSDENSFDRFEQLASASWTGRVLPLSRLDGGFSDGPTAVNVAYAESADFVGYLLRKGGPARFAVMLEHVRLGLSFEDAVDETWGSPLARIEEDWRKDMSDRFALAPLWAGTGLLSVAGLVLVVAAMLRRRKKNRVVVARWAREERVDRSVRDVVIARAARSVIAPHLRLVPPPPDGEGRPRGDDELQRVSHDGHEHTVH